MLRIINKTDSDLSIDNYELHARSSIDVEIPYTSNLRFLEKINMIAVVELANSPPIVEDVQQPSQPVEPDVVSKKTSSNRKKQSKKNN